MPGTKSNTAPENNSAWETIRLPFWGRRPFFFSGAMLLVWGRVTNCGYTVGGFENIAQVCHILMPCDHRQSSWLMYYGTKFGKLVKFLPPKNWPWFHVDVVHDMIYSGSCLVPIIESTRWRWHDGVELAKQLRIDRIIGDFRILKGRFLNTRNGLPSLKLA